VSSRGLLFCTHQECYILFSKFPSRICGVVCFAAASSLSLVAQVGQPGTLDGTVAASDHSPVPFATVLLTGQDGFTREVSTGQDGTFTIRALPSGSNYKVSVTAPGFRSAAEQPGISVAVGRTTQLTLTLSLGTTNETVNVIAQPSPVDTNQTSSVVNIDRDRVEELPIPSRNYLSFVQLSPQAAPANPALSQNTLTQGGGTLAFSFGGIRPGSNSVRIDGVDDDDEFSGSSRTQLSPEAINDFQIVNHGFRAQSGGAAGGAMDVQTRAGLNSPHGDAFIFAQNGALNGTPPLGIYPRKPDESRFRAGIALGAALQPDRTFFYIAAEQELARGEDVNDLQPGTLALINTALRQTGPLNGFSLGNGFFPTTDQETELSGRLDRVLTPQQTLMARYAFTNARNVDDAFHTDELTDRSARGSSFVADNSVNATLTSTFGGSRVNSLRFELSLRRAVERTENPSTPGVLIPGVALFGTPFEGNSRRFETHVDGEDSFLFERGHHLFQAGIGVEHVALRAQVLDGFSGLFVFPTVAALQAGNADFFTRSFGSPTTNFAESRVNAFLQDHWQAGRTLTLDYGLRYEINRLPSPFPTTGIDFSPRVGFAWTARPSLVVRGGFGLFYDRYLLSSLNRVLEFDGAHTSAQIVEGPAAASLYASGSLPSSPLPGVVPSIWRADPRLINPYSEVGSLSVEQALPLQTTLKAEYQFVHGVHLGRTVNSNLLPPVLLTTGNAASLGFPSPTAQQLGRPFFTSARVDPGYDAVNRFSTTAGSNFNGATVTLNRQFQDDFELLAGYTYSKTIDDASSDLEQSQNPFDPGAERTLSLLDQRHRFTLSGLWLIGPDLGDPADAARNANPGPLMRVLNGLEFAPIFQVSSGFRANPLTSLDSNREHVYPFAARPTTYSRNSLSTSPNINFDLRVLKMVPVAKGHLDIVAESFNLLNHRNVSLLNIAFGSNIQAQSGFDRPIATSTARRIQFSLDYEF
jgi:hypothetical protein